MADMKSVLQSNDEWLRHRIRAIYWKQWKKVKTRFKELKKLGVEEEKAWICANMRNGNKMKGAPLIGAQVMRGEIVSV